MVKKKVKQIVHKRKKPLERFVEKSKVEAEDLEVAEVVKAAPQESGAPKCVECGEPVAPGQSTVCVKHQRSR